MQTPEAQLSGSELATLRFLANGGEAGFALDWLAIQRLKQFGFAEETLAGPKITTEGRRVVRLREPQA
jgi:hypothetical protein